MKRKKVLCFIFVLTFSFSMVMCSKTDGSGTTAQVQSNQEDNYKTIVSQSSDTEFRNTHSQSKLFVEDKYRGEFERIESVAVAEEHYSDDDPFLYAYTSGNALFCANLDWHGGEGLANQYKELGTFTDINTFVVYSENSDNSGESGIYKRK